MLSPISRWLTRLVGVLFLALGAAMFLAPGWAADEFPWRVTPLTVMTMGAWYLGSVWLAYEMDRRWDWSAVYPCAALLWSFSFLEGVLMLVHQDVLVMDRTLSWPYVLTLAVAAITAVVGVADWFRMRPSAAAIGAAIPRWVHAEHLVLAVLVFFLALYGSFTFGERGSIFAHQLTPITAQSFGMFYGSIGIASLGAVLAGGLHAVLPFQRAGRALIVLIMVAAVVYVDEWDLSEHPWQYLYWGIYIAALIASALISLYDRAQHTQAAKTAAAT